MTRLASSSFAPLQDIDVSWRSNGEYFPSQISGLSQTSAFVKTPRPEPVGTILDLRLNVPGRAICAQAVVRRVVPGRGMAVEFESMSDGDRASLYLLVVQQLERAPLPRAGRSSAAAPSATHGSPKGSAQAERPAAPHRGHHRIEQRSRIRHKFAATVELTEPRTARSVHAQLADLAIGGCYVKLAKPFPVGTELEISVSGNGQSFHARATVTSEQPGDGMGLAFTDIAPQERLILDGWLARFMERSWLASNRRRSHRIMVNIPVHVAAKDSSGSEISEETKTVSVSAHGALLHLAMDVVKGQTLLLRNTMTDNALECSVDYLGATRNGRREVGVSFLLPNQTLWQIAFPPEDWSPQHPYAKRAQHLF